MHPLPSLFDFGTVLVSISVLLASLLCDKRLFFRGLWVQGGRRKATFEGEGGADGKPAGTIGRG